VTTPPADPAERARAALGVALGVIAPEAIPLQDGRVRLTGSRDLLSGDVLDTIDARLTRRAADHVTQDRLLAEAVAMLGTELSRARGGTYPADGATAALDALLDVPDLPQESRVEAEALLRVVLEGNAEVSDSAAARLAARAAEQRTPRVADLLESAREISREARLLGTTGPSPAAVSPVEPRSLGAGRHRRVVGRHRRDREKRTTATFEIDGTGLSAEGRPSLDHDLTEGDALAAIGQVRASDLGSNVTGPPTVLSRPQVAVIETESLGRQHFRVHIAAPTRGRVAEAEVRSGSLDDPHVLRISPRLDNAQLARVWVHQLSHTLQEAEAARAGRPTGIVARIRSAFSREGRDRALTAQYDEYRLLTRNWQEARAQTAATGRATGSQSVAELERDIKGLAAAIKRRGPAPAFPWASDSIKMAAVQSPGSSTSPVPAPSLPNTPAHLREQVVAELTALDAAITDLEARATAKQGSAAVAAEKAKEGQAKAVAEAQLKDQGAPERARKLAAEAVTSADKSQRHTEIAAAYSQAAEQAGHARDGYQTLLNELDAVAADPRRATTGVLPLAEAAADRVDAYRLSIVDALPRRDVLHSGAPTGRLPQLIALTERINDKLAENNLQQRFTPEMLHRTLRAEFRRTMSPDGLVLPVGGDAHDDVGKLAQLRIRLRAGELAEVLDPDVQLAELMVGQLEQGGHGVATTATHTFGRNGGFNLKSVMALMPDSSALKAASEVVAPGFEFAFGRSRSVTSSATEYALGGAVEDNRGESLLFEAPAEWELELRTSALDEWSPVETIDTADPRDTEALRLWLSHAYTVKPPASTIDISQFNEPRSEELPEHVATGISGLNELTDEVVAKTRDKLGSLDRVAHDQIRGLLTEDLSSRLDEAAKAGGIGRLVISGGKPVYVQVRTKVVWETAELVGGTSSAHWQERLRVGFSGATGNESFGASTSGSVSAGYPGTALTDLGTTTADLGPKLKAGRSVSRDDAMSAGGTAIHPSVQRYMGPTQGYRMRLEHTVTVHRVGGNDSFSVGGAGNALLRIPENDAFRYGLPVDEAAVLRTDDGRPRVDKDGRTLLRGDPLPTENELKLPTWLGGGEHQLRGAGPALVQRLTGADAALAATLKELSTQRLLPPLDLDGRPKLEELPSDPLLRTSQLLNLERVTQHLSSLRLETGYDSAAQGGLALALVDHRTGRAPRTRTFRIALHQKFDEATPRGLTTSEAVVNLDIGSNTSARSGGRSKRLPWSFSLGLSDKPGADEAGQTPEIGASYGRIALGRFFGWSTGGTVNQVTLVESTAPVAVFDIPHTLVVTEVTEHGDSAPLAEVEGNARVLIDSELLEPATAAVKMSERQSQQQPGEADQAVLDAATILHLDAGNPLPRVVTALGVRPGSAGYHHFAGFFNPRNLIAHPEWMHTEYRTRLAVTPAPSTPAQAAAQRGLLPKQASVAVRGRVKGVVFLRATNQVTGDINLTLSSFSATEGSSTANNVAFSGGDGFTGADGLSWGGSGGASRSGSASRSRTDSSIWGWERLKIEVGGQYVFRAEVEFQAEVGDGNTGLRKVQLEDGTMLFTVPERDALRLYGQKKLDLPLAQVADATERFLQGGLTLDRRTATALIRRYQLDKAGVTGGLAGTHSHARLGEKLREVSGLSTPAAGSAAEKLATTLDDAEQVAALRTEVSLPEHYNTTMGAALIEQVELTDQAGESVDVLRQVRAAVDQASPGALGADAVLAESLYGDLAGKRWRGHLDDMLDPRGFVKEYPVQVSGTGPPDRLVVRISARFEGPITTSDPVTAEGKPDGATESAIIIVQGYDYDQHGRARTRGTSYGANVGSAGTDGASVAGGISTDRSRQLSESSEEQSTRLQRLNYNSTMQVERGLRLVIEVERTPVRGAATMGRLRQLADRLVPQERGSSSKVELSGRLTQLVPKELVGAAPSAVTTSAAIPDPSRDTPDHRTVTLPSSYFVESTRPHLRDEPAADTLFDTVFDRLSDGDMLTSAGVRLHRTELENQLSASARSAAFERIADDLGHTMVRLPVPGHGRKAVTVKVRAVVSELELVGQPVDDVQLGEVDRSQRSTRTTSSGTRLLPVSGSGDLAHPGSEVKGGVSVGEQVSEQVTDTTGNRNELSKFEKGTVVTVRVRLDYDLTFERWVQNRQGGEKVDRSENVPKAAAGEAYLTMFQHEYLAMCERMESGAALASALDVLDGARDGVPPSRAERGVSAEEYADDGTGTKTFHPYRPLIDALAQARQDGVPVALSVRQRDGESRTYRAFPDGTMTGTDDGGFAAAFATLHPRLALLAEGRVDLRELFNTSPRSARFTGAVTEALRNNGVPASVLTELDHSLASRAAATRKGTDGARRNVGGQTTSPAGPGLSFP
jgi:hypothetical protein